MIWSDLVLVIMQTECMDSWVMCVAWKGIWTEINCDLVRFSPPGPVIGETGWLSGQLVD